MTAPFFLLALLLLSTTKVHARSSNAPFLIPRGGADNDNSNLGERFQPDAKMMDLALEEFQTAATRLREVAKRCGEMNDKTTTTIQDLDMDLLRLAIQQTMLPPGLLPFTEPFQYLKDELTGLKNDAMTMHTKLKMYISIVEESLTLVQKLVDSILLNQKGLLSSKNMNRWQLKKFETKFRKESEELKQLTQFTATRVGELDQEAHQHVWKDFQETAKEVQAKAMRIDEFVKTMRGKRTQTTQNETPVVSAPFVVEVPQEVEVQMTMYTFNS